MAQNYTANTNLNGKDHQQKHHFNIKIGVGACTQNMGKALEEPINNASLDNNTRRNFYSVTLSFLKNKQNPHLHLYYFCNCECVWVFPFWEEKKKQQ